MPIQPINVLAQPVPLAELNEVVARLQKHINYLQSKNIDSENTREIGGWIISPIAMMAKDGDVGMSTADTPADDVRFWAGSTNPNTAPWRVYESGVGVATGWVVQSSNGSYPYVIVDPNNDLIGAYAAADKYIRIAALNGTTTSPAMVFNEGSDTYFIYASPSTDELVILGTGDISLGSVGQTVVFPGANIRVSDWSNVYSSGDSQTLQQALDNKANSFLGYTGIVTVVTNVDFATSTQTKKNLHFTNGILSIVT